MDLTKKSDDNQLATKKDIRMIVGTEIKKSEKRMDEKLGSLEKRMEKKMDEKGKDLWDRFYEYAASKEDLKQLEQRMMDKMVTKDEFRKMMGTLDHLLYEMTNWQTDRASQILINERVEENLINHEKRIKVLEKV